jgi:DNA primase
VAAARIRDDDIALVRERARVEEVVSAYVTLSGAGAGSLKGLCPFHDEKSPSFHVTPARGFYHCFGCQEGGDVITFVEKIEAVGFTEAVERLAGRYGVELHYIDDGGTPARRDPGQRTRLIEAHRQAAEFYQHELELPEALIGRRFLEERGFGKTAAARFGIGYAPRDGQSLLKRLRAKGFTDQELTTAGLVGRGSRGPHDRFRGRLVWPIRELSGEVVGFGARRLYDDDVVSAKYLNTAETPIYKKSQLLYGADLARKDIARTSQAVVVEGYTDVMACHLAGVATAVATCGTAFGDDHGRVLRRLLLDHDEMRGEIIFTFDGDEAGQKAALRAFSGDQQFVGQTYVAVEPEGRDPCELRMAEGDAAVRELIARRVPLYRFVLHNVVARFDLDRADSRVDALREAARLVASVRDKSKVEAFAREVAALIGNLVEPNDVLAEVRKVQRGPSRSSAPSQVGSAARSQPPAEDDAAQRRRREVPDPGEHRFSIERDTLKIAFQAPDAMAEPWSELDIDDFTHPYHRAIVEVVQKCGGPTAVAPEIVVRDVAEEPVRRLVSALSVEPLHAAGPPDARLAAEYVVRLRELTAMRRINAVKSRLQRMNPVTQTTEYNRLFGELVALESHRRALRERAIGTRD